MSKSKKDSNAKMHPLYALEYWKIKAFFEDDKTIKVSDIDNANKSCTITVDDILKKAVLETLLKPESLKVEVVVDGLGISEDMVDYLLKSHPHYDHLEVASDKETGFIADKALMFKPDVMHYFSDDMFSPTGHTAILPYQLAREILDNDLNYQTELR